MPSFERITSSLAWFASVTRRYELKLDGVDLGVGGLLVEAFAAGDYLQAHGARHVTMVSTNAALRAGTRFTLTQGPLACGEAEFAYVVGRLVSVGRQQPADAGVEGPGGTVRPYSGIAEGIAAAATREFRRRHRPGAR